MHPNRGMTKTIDTRRRHIAVLLAALAALSAQPAAANQPDAALVKGKEFVKVRSDLLKAGWKPAPTKYALQNGKSEDEYGEASRLYRAGYVEVEVCTEGSVHCIFNYRRGKDCLQLTTQGQHETYKGRQYPLLVKWTNDCSNS